MKRIHPLIWILLLALSVRLIGIATRPIWYDEAFSILFSEKGPAAMLYGTLTSTGAGTADIHPLTYYSLLWAWMLVFGKSLIAIRLLSILIGVGSVALVYFLGRDLLNERAALLGATIATLAPFQIHYAQEIRMYALLAFALLAATGSLWRAMQTKRRLWWLVFMVTCALAQYAHNLAAFYLIPLALIPLFNKDWKSLRMVVYCGVGAILLYLPWGINLPAQFAKVQAAYWTERPGPEHIFTTLLSFVTNLPLPQNWLFPALGITLIAIALAAWQTYRAAWAHMPRWESGAWLLYLTATPPALLFIFSQWKPVYIERALLPSGAVFCLWLAWAFLETGLPRVIRTITLSLLALAAAMGTYQHVTYTGFPYAPYNALSAALTERRAPGDVIVHSSKLSLLPTLYYDASLPQLFIADPPGSGVDTLAPATQQVLAVVSASNMEAATKDALHVWLIIFEQSVDEYTAAGEATHPHLAWLQAHYRLATEERFGDLILYQFEKQDAP